MSTTMASPHTPGPPRQGMPRWAWAIVALLLVPIVLAVVIAIGVTAGPRESHSTTSPVAAVPLPPAPKPASSLSPTQASTPAATLADGCAGGASELDQAVITAQKQSPLTPAGAASFTATLERWSFAGPPPAFQKRTSKQIFTANATSAARRSLSSSRDLKGSTGTMDFSTGRYYVKTFDGTSAIVSWLATGHLTDNGVAQPDVLVAGTVHLRSINGTWHYQNTTSERSIEDMQEIGIPYAGGC